ncbi:hypothetical protein GPZ77_31195 [Streptomyces sp. QHH-9511]|uniref:hypothetical protein n=1 Tax=Streptomyces sp. QHH-9511 TaxID=2684468 RepID=UPI001318B179|nr:hypothetical protein [Streptomyces sp. QHH-9511]QGZ52224.1 hypothetical protein GPZ77_31195 [Streptomyces sp. QHH-9511]
MLSVTRRTRRPLATAAAALVLTGCATVPARSTVPSSPQAQDELLRTAERTLVVRCLAARDLTLPDTAPARPPAPAEDRRLQAALFGTGPRELSLTLATGHTVTAHTDGCVAAARQNLYGDQTRWFRAQVTVDNLRAEAQARMKDDPAHRAALDRWTRCAAPPGRPRPERPGPAVAARCERESGLADVRARLEPVELAEVRALRGDQLATYRQLRTRALRRAAELSAGTTEQKGNDAS